LFFRASQLVTCRSGADLHEPLFAACTRRGEAAAPKDFGV
jgi:hypothetical protein